MKATTRLIPLIALVTVVPAQAGGYCPVDAHHDSTQVTATQSQQVRLQVQGMTSASCPLLVKAALNKLSGVHDVQVDVQSNVVVVDYDPELVSVGQIQATIKDKAGFESKIVD